MCVNVCVIVRVCYLCGKCVLYGKLAVFSRVEENCSCMRVCMQGSINGVEDESQRQQLLKACESCCSHYQQLLQQIHMVCLNSARYCIIYNKLYSLIVIYMYKIKM